MEKNKDQDETKRMGSLIAHLEGLDALIKDMQINWVCSQNCLSYYKKYF